MPGNINAVPLDVIASWPPSDYDHGIRRHWLIPYAITLAVLSTSLVAIRIVLRTLKHGGGFGLDDIFLIPSWMLLIGFTAAAITSIDNGTADRHSWDVNPKMYTIGWSGAFSEMMLFTIGTCCLKVSILLFFRRLVKGAYKRQWIFAIWLAIAVTLVYSCGIALALIFSCNPVSAYWMSFDPEWAATHDYSCNQYPSLNVVSGTFGALSDLYSVLLPWIVLWNLQVPRRQKVGLNAIFSLGLTTVVLACLRTKAMNDYATLNDPAWYGFDSLIWSLSEWHLGTICACLPSLRVLFRRYFRFSLQRTRNTLSASRKKTQPSSGSVHSARHWYRTPSHDSNMPFTASSNNYKAEIYADPTNVHQATHAPPTMYRPRDQASHNETPSVWGTKQTDLEVASTMM